MNHPETGDDMVPVKSRALFWLPLAFILLLGGCLGSSGE